MKNSIIIILLLSCSMILSKEQEDDYSLYSKTSVGFNFLSPSTFFLEDAPNEHQPGVYFTTHSAGMIFELYFVYKFIGSEVDWDQDDMQSSFIFRNPNEQARCGCGESFTI